jgi:hypothetical protein
MVGIIILMHPDFLQMQEVLQQKLLTILLWLLIIISLMSKP